MAVQDFGEADNTQSNLVLLELRLRRLEFLTTGSGNLDGIPDGLRVPERHDDTVTAKLAELQKSLERLRRLEGSGGFVIRETEAIRKKIHLRSRCLAIKLMVARCQVS